jgi:hypothetical protein
MWVFNILILKKNILFQAIIDKEETKVEGKIK